MSLNSQWKKNIINLMMLWTLNLIYSSAALCQYWAALPPYNTLWPLWSSVLSPLDPITGRSVPIISNLDPETKLPLQPGLTWNPEYPFPWLLYNTPLGMIYYDPIYGMNLWPPSELVSPTGTPILTALSTGYSDLPPTDPAWILNTIPLGNALYTLSYPYYSYIASLPVPAILILPPISLLNLSSLLNMLSVPAINPDTIPPLLSANTILGL